MNEVEFYEHLRHLREKYGIQWDLLEQDYLLSWMLAGIAAVPELAELVIFKGGTALKKSYFGEYRFSQDLDFTVVGTLPDDLTLAALMHEACNRAMELQKAFGYPISISSERYMEKRPHPHNQKAFTIAAQFPKHREPLTRIMVEITTQERLLLPPVQKSIIHTDYNETLEASLKTYRLEEIVAEKVRALLEFAAKLHERGWARSRARDYYDLWRILNEYQEYMDISLLPEMVIQKCKQKNIVFTGPQDLFTDTLMKNLEEAWDRWLSPFVPGLPSQSVVIPELKRELEKIWFKNSAIDFTRQNSTGEISH